MTNRREFLKTSGIVLGATALETPLIAGSFASKKKVLNVGLVGCGGRGTGAVFQALQADPDVKITALADVFENNLEETLTALIGKYGNRIDVPEERRFLGFDAYEKLIKSQVDVVLLCTPPNFRPAHLALAIKHDKHVFCEKPVAVDIPGVHVVQEAVRLAKEKNLCVMSGFCFRYSFPNRELISRIHNGDIGDIHAISTFRLGGELSFREPVAGSSELEQQIRNWFYYQRYSGDMIVEQTVHSIDFMNWILKERIPAKVTAMGGRQSRPWNKFGNVYDHFTVEYVYDDGFRGFHFGRQQNGTTPRNTIEALGSKGRIDVALNTSYEIFGDKPWKNTDQLNNMYQTEHDELFKAIRENRIINDGDYMANSTLMAIWGRASAYSGKTISYDEIVNSKETLGPIAEEYSWEMEVDKSPIARQGVYKFS